MMYDMIWEMSNKARGGTVVAVVIATGGWEYIGVNVALLQHQRRYKQAILSAANECFIESSIQK